MTHIHSVGLNGLPEPLRSILANSGDPEKERMRHEIQAREKADFWNSLDKGQLAYLAGLLMSIVRSETDEAQNVAARALGLAEAHLMTRYDSCACGTVHRDPSSFMADLMREADEAEAVRKEAETLGLRRIEPGAFIEPSVVGKFVCIKCDEIFDTVEERRKAASGESHDGCEPN